MKSFPASRRNGGFSMIELMVVVGIMVILAGLLIAALPGIQSRINRNKVETLYLEDDLTGLIKEIRSADIEREFTKESFPFRLLSGLAGEDGDPESLQIAWDLVKEAKA